MTVRHAVEPHTELAPQAPRPATPEALPVQAARRGDRRALETILRRFAGPLHALVRRAGLADPDDVTQDLLARIASALPGFDPAGSATLATWVFTLAHRHLIDAGRKRRLTLVPLAEASDVIDGGPSPADSLERRELATALEAAILELPETQRRVFLLAQVHGQPLEAIAAEEGVAVGTVKSRLHRARAVLAARLEPERKP